MNIAGKFIRRIVPVLTLFASVTVFAHTAVTVTEPKNGAVLTESPKQVVIRFSDEAYLNSISLINAEGNEVPLTSSLPEALSRRFNIALPTLEQGTYTVIFSAEGTDTHAIQGELSFSVVQPTL